MNRNSALIWLPKIVEAGISTPQTELVKYEHEAVREVFDGGEPKAFDELLVMVRTACKKIGYPIFVRTDLSSAKHDGPKAYRINKEEDIPRAIYATLEDNEMKFWLEPEGSKAILVREWLELQSPFAAFNRHAIAYEWRFFANAERVICFHPYWPESSIEFYGGAKEPDGWREALRTLHQIPENIEELKAVAVKAAGLYGTVASIDMAQDRNTRWWLTDMAIAEDSFHWPDCEHKELQVVRSYFDLKGRK